MNDLSQESMSWSEVTELTHATQVERFNWCSCEEQEYFPYADCPRECDVCEAKDGEPHCNCGNCDCGKDRVSNG